MARLHPNKLRAEIKSETAMTSGAYEIYRKKSSELLWIQSMAALLDMITIVV